MYLLKQKVYTFEFSELNSTESGICWILISVILKIKITNDSILEILILVILKINMVKNSILQIL